MHRISNPKTRYDRILSDVQTSTEGRGVRCGVAIGDIFSIFREGTVRVLRAEFAVLRVSIVSVQSSPVLCVIFAQYIIVTAGDVFPSNVVARRS